MTGIVLNPSRSAFLELKEERQLVREGYEFLDEKRVIIAQEMLRRLAAWQAAHERYDRLHEQAAAALARAVGRHGLDGLGLYPAERLENADLALRETRFLGARLLDGEFHAGMDGTPGAPTAVQAVNPSPEAEQCRRAFAALVPLGFELGVMRATLERLMQEYVRTERRARALENVILPEIESSLAFMDEQLETMDQEEAIRVRNAARHA